MELTLPLKASILESLSSLVSFHTEPVVCLQVIPHFGVNNGRKIENIIDGIYSLYKPLQDRFIWRDRKLTILSKECFYYGILIEPERISFHYVIPKPYKEWITQRIYATFNNQVTVIPSNTDYLDSFNRLHTSEWELYPKFKAFKSFISDYRENAPIPSILSTNKDLQNGDKVLLELCLSPIENNNWKERVTEQQYKFKHSIFDNSTNSGKIGYIFDKIFGLLDSFFDFFDLIMEIDDTPHYNRRYKHGNSKDYSHHGYYDDENDDFLFTGGSFNYGDEYYRPNYYSSSHNYNRNGTRQDTTLSSSSRQKINFNGFEGKVRILSQSEDKVRREMMARTLTVGLKDIAEDNEFILEKKLKTSIDRPKVYFWYGPHVYSSKEIGQMLQLPERKWQDEYPVEKVETQEIIIPKELFNGGIPIGNAKYKGKVSTVYWNRTNRDIACLPKCLFGNQGTGKSSYLIKYAVEAAKLGRSVFILDGIKRCELANDIRDALPKSFPESKIIDLDFSNLDYVIPLSWNEINIKTIKGNTSEKLIFSNNLSQELIKFLDSLVETSEKLSPRMKRYLSSAGILTFSVPDTTIIDVLECLTDYDKRHELIEKSSLSEGHKVVQDLLTLDDSNRGTKINLVQGIVDRMDLLVGDFVLNNIFSTKGSQDIDFRRWIKDKCVVICRMPDDLSESTVKTLTTFLMSKIWFAKLSLSSEVSHTLVICDEVHRTGLKLENIREMRKYGLEYFFSAHQPQDFKNILNTLKSAGCSFMLLSTTKDNVEHFKYEIHPFTVEEALKIKKFHSLNIVNYDREFITFYSELPGLIPAADMIDRSFIVDRCSRLYGKKIEGIF